MDEKGFGMLFQALSSSRQWHWPRLPRLSRHSHAERAAKKAAAKFKAEAKVLRRQRLGSSAATGVEGGPGPRSSFLLRILAPEFFLHVLRVLTQSAAQVRPTCTDIRMSCAYDSPDRIITGSAFWIGGLHAGYWHAGGCLLALPDGHKWTSGCVPCHPCMVVGVWDKTITSDYTP